MCFYSSGWSAVVFGKLKSLHLKYACEEYNEAVAELEQEAGYSLEAIPQLSDVSSYLESKTGEQQPVGGAVSGVSNSQWVVLSVSRAISG